MSITRIGRHLLQHHWQLKRIFTPDVLARIEQAIQDGERSHAGQLRFVVEGALDGRPLWRNQPPRERALDLFSHLRIWDTAHNNGVLIYLLLADRDVEIIADRGIHAKVGAARWETTSIWCWTLNRRCVPGRIPLRFWIPSKRRSSMCTSAIIPRRRTASPRGREALTFSGCTALWVTGCII